MFDKIRQKWREMTQSSQQNQSPDQKQQDQQKSNYTSTYSCASCGKALTGGPALYCDGCGQYRCYSCGIASGDMIWDCPNCAIQCQRVNL